MASDAAFFSLLRAFVVALSFTSVFMDSGEDYFMDTTQYIASPEDFVVREHIKPLPRYVRGKNTVTAANSYCLCKLTKRLMTTHRALTVVASLLDIDVRAIGFAGLKDKFAVTEQFVTVPSKMFKEVEIMDLRLTRIGFVSKPLAVGDVEKNDFEIRLTGVAGIERALEEVNRTTIPNFFGPQRFGAFGTNATIGKRLITRDYENALEAINKTSVKAFSSITAVGKRRLKFYVNAYQSFLFNEAVALYLLTHRMSLRQQFKIVGCTTRLGRSAADAIVKTVLDHESISHEDFEIKELRMSVRGGMRQAFIKTAVIYANGKLCFSLPAGSYATVVIAEIVKRCS